MGALLDFAFLPGRPSGSWWGGRWSGPGFKKVEALLRQEWISVRDAAARRSTSVVGVGGSALTVR